MTLIQVKINLIEVIDNLFITIVYPVLLGLIEAEIWMILREKFTT